MSIVRAVARGRRGVANLDTLASTVAEVPKYALPIFAVGLLALGLIGSALALRTVPSPTQTTLLYTALAAAAELIVVPPRHAGWPSRLYPIATLMVVGDAPLCVIPALILALLVRSARQLAREKGSRPSSLRLFEVGAWLVAGVVGAETARQIAALPIGRDWAPTLTSPATGEPIHLAIALTWAMTTASVILLAGLVGARVGGYTWAESFRLANAPRVLRRSVLVGLVAYAIVASCDLLLGSDGPQIVASAVALTLGVFSWQGLRQKERLAVLVGLAEVVDGRDTTTANHLRTVEDLTAGVSAELGLPNSTVEAYANAALLHDLGKVAVSPRVLKKPGKLNEDEWGEMRSHAAMGRAILRVLPGFSTAAAIAGHHHERWDGWGYPDGLRAADIPLAARIVTAVDAFDAMTSDRPYHQGISIDVALEELNRQSGKQFDPVIVPALRRVVERRSLPPVWQLFPMIEE